MFDTLVTIVGNAITMPEWRRIQSSQSLVANFKVAANSRRYDKSTNRWVDGASLRVRVSCWRRLAENVAASVTTGDPLIVTGRLYSRDWVTEDGQHRVSYELDAVAVGHDLARGRGRFTRQRAIGSTSVVEDVTAEERVRGEASVPVPELNDRPRTETYDDELGGYVTAVESDEVVQMMHDAGVMVEQLTEHLTDDDGVPVEDEGDRDADDDVSGGSVVGAAESSDGSGRADAGTRRRRGRVAVPA